MFESLGAILLLVFHVWWFHRCVLKDEKDMKAFFRPPFKGYARRVRRWGIS